MANYDADIIVVGAGGFGSVVAMLAAKEGKSVIMLEAGPKIPYWKIIENWRSSPRKDNFVDPYGDYPWAPTTMTKGYLNADIDVLRWPGTARVVGGTSRHWTAITWRFLPDDFKINSLYGIGYDWPISYEDLEPYYTEAEYYLGVSGLDSDDQSGQHDGQPYPPRSKPYPTPPEAKPYIIQRMQMRLAEKGMRIIHAPSARPSVDYNGRPACIGNNLCQPECPIGCKFSGAMAADHALEANVELRYEVVVDKLEQDANGKITSLSYQTKTGERHHLTAKTFVIAGHALETPKLLLMNDLATGSGYVGRNLMIHTGAFSILEADEPVWAGRGQYSHGSMVHRRNMPDRDKIPGYTMALWNQNYTAQLTEMLIDNKMIGEELDKAIPETVGKSFINLTLMEDLPVMGNGISLNSNWKDALGLPGLNYTYKVQDYTKAAEPRIFSDTAVIAEAMGVTKAPTTMKWICHDHLMGTVMMGDDPQKSVVDKNLRCHDHENLFLVTTGVFPSSATFNPTLTGYALAFRAGHHIAKEVQLCVLLL